MERILKQFNCSGNSNTKEGKADTRNSTNFFTADNYRNSILLGSSIGGLLVLLAITIPLVLWCCRKEMFKVDTSRDYEYEDGDAVVEIIDENQEYGGVYEEGVTKAKDNNSNYEFSMDG